MSTEYRRGIPSVAHVEAATRLGLLWYAEGRTGNWRFHGVNGDVQLNLQRTPGRGPLTSAERNRSYRPIRTDGTPVDWEVLDAEVARVTQPATVTPTAPATPTTQPQGFRADLWRRISRHFSLVFRSHNQVSSLTEISSIDYVGISSPSWQWGWGTADREAPTRQNRTDILTRWAVYQELKPLYDIVDGAQGEVTMPRDVELAWAYCVAPSAPFAEGWFLFRDESGLRARLSWWGLSWRPEEDGYGVPLRNFAAVLDAVAEQRVAARQGQAVQSVATIGTLEVRPAPSPEPRSFADVRPDRHGWRWWRQTGRDGTDLGQRFETLDGRCRWRSAHADAWFVPDTANPQMLRYTVIPTDEQGNPVSWESIGQRRGVAQVGRTEMLIYVHTDGTPINAETVRAVKPTPLPRFTTDELDDVDHSATTTQDSATLKRGKLPTVEAIGKYREVMAKRNGTVAEAVKASGIDCEVAQYVLERWAGGLSDDQVPWFIVVAVGTGRLPAFVARNTVDERVQAELYKRRPILDISEHADTAAQRQRAEAAERKARMTALQAQLAKERAARVAEPTEEPTRFSLLEVDEAADPVRSIEAWKAQRARNIVRPIAVPAPQPTPATRRKAFEVVDAQAEGLSGGAAFAVLLSRALNQNC